MPQRVLPVALPTDRAGRPTIKTSKISENMRQVFPHNLTSQEGGALLEAIRQAQPPLNRTSRSPTGCRTPTAALHLAVDLVSQGG